MSGPTHNIETKGESPGSSASLGESSDLPTLIEETGLFYRTDSQGIIRSISSSVQSLLDVPPHEILGKPFAQFFDLKLPDAAIPQGIERRFPDSVPLHPRISVARNARGEILYLQIIERDFFDAQGNHRGQEGFAFDLTCHIRAELLLLQTKEKYRRLIEELGEDYAIYTHLPDGTLTYVSPSVRHVLGYSSEELIGRNWRELIGENFHGRDLADQVRTDVQSGIRFHKFCVEIAGVTGERKLIEVQQRPTFSPEGKYESMEGIAKDITEFTRNAEELRRLKDELEQRVDERTAELLEINDRLVDSESRYRSVVEDQTEFICRWQPDGSFTFINDAYSRYRSSTNGNQFGNTFFSAIHPEDRPRLESEIATLTPEKPTAVCELRLHRSDSTAAWVLWTNRAFFDEHRHCLGYQSVGRDITELKIAEDRVQEREYHLKRVSRLATLGELISGIAHEIHQPLHAAQLFAEAARRNLEQDGPAGIPTAIDCSKEISHAIARTAKIIRQLRSFTTSKPIKIEPFDMNEVIQEVANFMGYEIRKSHVTLRLDLESRLPLSKGDRIHFQQILVHLFRNAIEAMLATDSLDKVLLVSTQFDEEFVFVNVSDNGCGTAETDLERMFDPFYSTKPDRLGMGLSICRTIATSLNAQIVACHNPDQGMCFSIQLLLASRVDR